jgi:transposase InsO family protein
VVTGRVAVPDGAGAVASSTALLGFGLDSLIEVFSATTLACQFTSSDPQRRERTAPRIIAASFFALAGYLTVQALRALTGHGEARPSTVGLALTKDRCERTYRRRAAGSRGNRWPSRRPHPVPRLGPLTGALAVFAAAFGEPRLHRPPPRTAPGLPMSPTSSPGTGGLRAFVVDVYSRAIVGWSTATNKRTPLVLNALDMGCGAATVTGTPSAVDWSMTRMPGSTPRSGSSPT